MTLEFDFRKLCFNPIHCAYSNRSLFKYLWTPVLGLGLGVDFSFAWDNNNNNDNENNDNNPHLNFVKGTVLGDKEQGVGIRDKG